MRVIGAAMILALIYAVVTWLTVADNRGVRQSRRAWALSGARNTARILGVLAIFLAAVAVLATGLQLIVLGRLA